MTVQNFTDSNKNYLATETNELINTDLSQESFSSEHCIYFTGNYHYFNLL